MAKTRTSFDHRRFRKSVRRGKFRNKFQRIDATFRRLALLRMLLLGLQQLGCEGSQRRVRQELHSLATRRNGASRAGF